MRDITVQRPAVEPVTTRYAVTKRNVAGNARTAYAAADSGGGGASATRVGVRSFFA